MSDRPSHRETLAGLNIVDAAIPAPSAAVTAQPG
jgi:hypothetical protein